MARQQEEQFSVADSRMGDLLGDINTLQHVAASQADQNISGKTS